MKIAVLPAPNGMPAAIGAAQCIDLGTQVQANQSWPIGVRHAAMQTIDIMASGGGSPVSGSGLWELIKRRMSGSRTMMHIDPIPIPTNARPDIAIVQPRNPVKTIGYATKQRYSIPEVPSDLGQDEADFMSYHK